MPSNSQPVQQVLDILFEILISSSPLLQQMTSDLIDVVFCPKIIAKQFALAIAIDMGMVTLNQVSRFGHHILSNFSSRSKLIRQIQKEQNNASTQDEWMELAERIDNLQGNDVWRSDPNCQMYERRFVSGRIDELTHLMRKRDIFAMTFELRGGIGRNKFGLLHEGLFSKAMAGSKLLVETYHNAICATLDFICDTPDSMRCPGTPPVPTDARLAFFNEVRHTYGRTALLLSGGAALGIYHAGVVKALMLNNLMPRVLGGSSAGSLVCAMVATRTDDEILNDLLNAKGTTSPGHSGELHLGFCRPLRDYSNDSEAFLPPALLSFISVMYQIVTGRRRPQDILMHDTKNLRTSARADIGNFTFQEAFDRTGRILNITVTPNNSSDPPRLLNYLTSPHVLVWSAAVASASLPGVFEANRLMVRDVDGTERYEATDTNDGGPSTYSDGSMEQDLPMQTLSELFNVNHFIISQANPHAVMLASYTQNKSIWANPVTGTINDILTFLKNQIKDWFQNVVKFIGARRITPLFDTQRIVGAKVITQNYEGRSCDISLVPWRGHRSVYNACFYCIYNPSDEEYFEWVQAAERETWKYIPAIKSHIAEEITLDLCVRRLRKRFIAEHNMPLREQRAKMDERVPSFFKSPSLMNFSRSCVSDDKLSIEGLKINRSFHGSSDLGSAHSNSIIACE